MDKRQQRAKRFEDLIKRRLTRIDHDWKRIARWLSTIFNEKLFEEWDFNNFGQYAESIGISASRAYDLVGVHDSLHKEILETLPISHACMLAHRIKDKPAREVKRMADDISELTWHDARQYLYGDDPAPQWFYCRCPACDAKLKSSKTVTLEVE